MWTRSSLTRHFSKNLGLYGQMASCLPRILKPGGSLFAMVPHFGIAHVLPAVSEYLKWRWLFCMWQEKENILAWRWG